MSWKRPTAAEITAAQVRVDEWNRKYPVGTPVELRMDDGSVVETQTRSEAWLLTCGVALVNMLGKSGGWNLDRVRPIKERA